ncbi:hypothetical protein A2477_04800 [Candidatus Falkowbacteria bacterium RIFOXYC2_FULL_47_12]|uniref:Uncharacterized protein n=2 Tax=Candidatus Falkowiibacteriota TaxID=1752728 RepID=A0A1F5TM90_9BACT|nr:MAG: hypothetical protein A2242_01515 [Candidatus Falkowbacteria bacterium RIFOXYA2_FULL_47_9]OGF40062.1 MAG: hypothetical protein A2477_04800 [Candidatus Falkowbacteria bacterium RIFOXYC2_FULL_47_12]
MDFEKIQSNKNTPESDSEPEKERQRIKIRKGPIIFKEHINDQQSDSHLEERQKAIIRKNSVIYGEHTVDIGDVVIKEIEAQKKKREKKKEEETRRYMQNFLSLRILDTIGYKILNNRESAKMIFGGLGTYNIDNIDIKFLEKSRYTMEVSFPRKKKPSWLTPERIEQNELSSKPPRLVYEVFLVSGDSAQEDIDKKFADEDEKNLDSMRADDKEDQKIYINLVFKPDEIKEFFEATKEKEKIKLNEEKKSDFIKHLRQKMIERLSTVSFNWFRECIKSNEEFSEEQKRALEKNTDNTEELFFKESSESRDNFIVCIDRLRESILEASEPLLAASSEEQFAKNLAFFMDSLKQAEETSKERDEENK